MSDVMQVRFRKEIISSWSPLVGDYLESFITKLGIFQDAGLIKWVLTCIMFRSFKTMTMTRMENWTWQNTTNTDQTLQINHWRASRALTMMVMTIVILMRWSWWTWNNQFNSFNLHLIQISRYSLISYSKRMKSRLKISCSFNRIWHWTLA